MGTWILKIPSLGACWTYSNYCILKRTWPMFWRYFSSNLRWDRNILNSSKVGTSSLQGNSGWPLRALGWCQAEEAGGIAVFVLCKPRSVLPAFTSSATVPHKCQSLNCSRFCLGATVTIVSRHRPVAILHFSSCCSGGCGHSILIWVEGFFCCCFLFFTLFPSSLPQIY